jgi:predicted lipid carrier protein YhbT
MESYLKVFKTQEDAGKVDAIISGNSLKLIDLLEGKTDGDALFFSRELDISGDMEKVVAFRNAIENAQIDVYEDVVSFFEPAKQTAMGAFVGLASKIDKHIDGLRSYILSPAMDKIDELNSKLDEMKNEKNS